MASRASTSTPNPAVIWDHINAYQRTACLRGAIELQLFTAIAEGAHTADALAGRCRASLRGMRILCDYLTVIGLLTKEDVRYSLTPDSAVFLDSRSPAYMGGMLRFLNSPALLSAFGNIAETVRRGTTILEKGGLLNPEDPVWVDFAQSMTPLKGPAAELIATLAAGTGPRRVLDIAAGHGLFGITIARRNPQAEITPVDWHAVLEVAVANARAAGVERRYHPLAGDAFQVDFGTGYDAVLLTNFLHGFDPPTCVRLLRKVRASLAPGGQLLTLELVPNEDRVSPPAPAAFSLVMLCATAGGDAYSFADLQAMLVAGGFARNQLHAVPQTPESVVVSSAG